MVVCVVVVVVVLIVLGFIVVFVVLVFVLVLVVLRWSRIRGATVWVGEKEKEEQSQKGGQQGECAEEDEPESSNAVLWQIARHPVHALAHYD